MPIHVHPCYSNYAHVFKNCNITKNIAPMPTQNPWAWGAWVWAPNVGLWCTLRATSHTRLRACDHYTSSTLIGGKGGAGPSSLPSHYTWGTNGVGECEVDVKSPWISTWHQIDYVTWSLGLLLQTTSCRRPYNKTERPWHSEHSKSLILFCCFMCEDLHA